MKNIAAEIEVCDYYQGNEAENDFLLCFPLQRLQEYFEFFQSLCVICPEDHPDYYYRSRILQELKTLITTVTGQMEDIKRYERLRAFILSFQGMPEWLIEPNREIFMTFKIFWPILPLPRHGIGILTSHEIILTTTEGCFHSILPLHEIEYTGERGKFFGFFSLCAQLD